MGVHRSFERGELAPFNAMLLTFCNITQHINEVLRIGLRGGKQRGKVHAATKADLQNHCTIARFVYKSDAGLEYKSGDGTPFL
jgi:hypothetical protein